MGLPQLQFTLLEVGDIVMGYQPAAIRQRGPADIDPAPVGPLPGEFYRVGIAKAVHRRFDIGFGGVVLAGYDSILDLPTQAFAYVAKFRKHILRVAADVVHRIVPQRDVAIGLIQCHAVGDIIQDGPHQGSFPFGFFPSATQLL